DPYHCTQGQFLWRIVLHTYNEDTSYDGATELDQEELEKESEEGSEEESEEVTQSGGADFVERYNRLCFFLVPGHNDEYATEPTVDLQCFRKPEERALVAWLIGVVNLAPIARHNGLRLFPGKEFREYIEKGFAPFLQI